MIINSAIIAQNITISSDVSDINVLAPAQVTVASGGEIKNARINLGAKLIIRSGASAGYGDIYGEEIVRGSSFSNNVYSGGKETIYSGGNIEGGTIKAGAKLIINAGASAGYGRIYGEEIIRGYGYENTVYSGGKETIYSGGEAGGYISSGGKQIVLKGGNGRSVYVSKGGVQLVSGKAELGDIYGSQTVYSGGAVSVMTISSGGKQTILKGGLASNCDVQTNGVQLVSGSARGGAIFGSQTIYSGGKAIFIAIDGKQTVARGGIASDCAILSEGSQNIQSGGKALDITIHNNGKQIIAKGGVASNCEFGQGTAQAVQAGGKAIGTRLNGGSMTLAGTATSAQVGQIGDYAKNRATMAIKKGGVARDTLVRDKLIVSTGGAASATTIASGNMTVAKGGIAKGVEMYGGKLVVQAGANVSSITTNYPDYLSIYGYEYSSSGSNQISFGKNIALGGANSFRNTTVSAAGALTLKSGASLTLYKVSLKGFTTNVAGATFNALGRDNKVLSFGKVNAKTTLNFDLTKNSLTERRMEHKDLLNDASRKDNILLTVSNKQTYAGKLSVSVNGLQIMESNRLCDGLIFKKNASVTVKMNGKSIGSVNVGGTLRKNGVSYKLTQTDGGQYHLNMTAVAGVMRKGTAKNETLTGGANCDIFYGGAGNDIIKGVNGHDVAYYDNKKWGKDTIAATNGSMTIYMAGLDSSALSIDKKGKDLVIKRKGVASDSITIRNYDENTHNIIYGGAVNEFSRYLNSAKPTAAMQTAARDALWKKTGLLA